MEFAEVVLARRSIRMYEDRPVEVEKLEYVLEAGRVAPSTGNRQSATFIVVREPETIAAIGKPYVMYNKWLPSAPAIIVACGDKRRAMSHHGVEFWQLDAAIAAEHMVLAAADVGLGTCWVGLFHPRAVRRALAIPKRMKILAMLAVGYPAQPQGTTQSVEAAGRGRERKPMSEFAHWEKW
jgi:nitroreductase